MDGLRTDGLRNRHARRLPTVGSESAAGRLVPRADLAATFSASASREGSWPRSRSTRNSVGGTSGIAKASGCSSSSSRGQGGKTSGGETSRAGAEGGTPRAAAKTVRAQSESTGRAVRAEETADTAAGSWRVCDTFAKRAAGGRAAGRANGPEAGTRRPTAQGAGGWASSNGAPRAGGASLGSGCAAGGTNKERTSSGKDDGKACSGSHGSSKRAVP